MITDIGMSDVLGRRARLWWGTAPSRLLLRGSVQAIIAAGALYAGRRASTGALDLAELGTAGDPDTVERIGSIVALLAIAWLVYCAVRIVVGVHDLFRRRRVDGYVLAVRERTRGDVLPGFVQDLIWSRGDKIDTRRSTLQLTLQTEDGPRMWRLSDQWRSRVEPGQEVRLTTTPLTGYVKKVDVLEPPA